MKKKTNIVTLTEVHLVEGVMSEVPMFTVMDEIVIQTELKDVSDEERPDIHEDIYVNSSCFSSEANDLNYSLPLTIVDFVEPLPINDSVDQFSINDSVTYLSINDFQADSFIDYCYFTSNGNMIQLCTEKSISRGLEVNSNVSQIGHCTGQTDENSIKVWSNPEYSIMQITKDDDINSSDKLSLDFDSYKSNLSAISSDFCSTQSYQQGEHVCRSGLLFLQMNIAQN